MNTRSFSTTLYDVNKLYQRDFEGTEYIGHDLFDWRDGTPRPFVLIFKDLMFFYLSEERAKAALEILHNRLTFLEDQRGARGAIYRSRGAREHADRVILALLAGTGESYNDVFPQG